MVVVLPPSAVQENVMSFPFSIYTVSSSPDIAEMIFGFGLLQEESNQLSNFVH